MMVNRRLIEWWLMDDNRMMINGRLIEWWLMEN